MVHLFRQRGRRLPKAVTIVFQTHVISAVFENPQYLTLEDCQSACEEETQNQDVENSYIEYNGNTLSS